MVADSKAAHIHEALAQGGDVEPFVLYLRPFASTDQISVTNTRISEVRVGMGPTGFVAMEERLEFEAEIEKALRKTGPVVALGRPLEHVGAGRVLVDDSEWQAEIKRLMQAAVFVVLLPSPREGTLWEVEQIIDLGLLPRTIIIDPPDAPDPAVQSYDPSAEWENMRMIFARRGFYLPEDDREGQLVWFGSYAAPQRVEKLGLGNGEGIWDTGVGALRRFARYIGQTAQAGAVASRQSMHGST